MTNATTTKTPIETIQAVYAAFARGDVAGLLDLVADDVDWSRDLDPAVPGWRAVPMLRNGSKDATLAYFQAVGETLEFHSFAPRAFASDGGENVLVVLDVDVTVRPTGRRIRYDEVHEFTVRGGRIVRYRPFLDTSLLIDAYTRAAD